MLFYCQLLLNFQGAEALLQVRSFSKIIIDLTAGTKNSTLTDP
jgi:hypothetical protein